MGYMPIDRREEDALDMYRVLDLSGEFFVALRKIVGDRCQMHPELKIACDSVMDALEDLNGEADGLLKRYDPDRVLENTARRERAGELLARAKEVLQPALRDPDHAITSRRAPAAAE
jgi:hypothetical protein